jgi:hypothetical protein
VLIFSLISVVFFYFLHIKQSELEYETAEYLEDFGQEYRDASVETVGTGCVDVRLFICFQICTHSNDYITNTKVSNDAFMFNLNGDGYKSPNVCIFLLFPLTFEQIHLVFIVLLAKSLTITI